MRDKARIAPMLDEIKIIWSLYPDMRLGQLLLNAVNEDHLYQAEDEDLLKAMRKLYLGMEDD